MALVGHSLYRIDRNIGEAGLDGLDGFFGDVWHGVKKGAQVVTNVGRIALVPVTGGASLLIPKAHFADKPAAPPPPKEEVTDCSTGQCSPALQAVYDAAQQVAAQVAATSAPVQNYTASQPPRGYVPPKSAVIPLQAGQYLVPPDYLNPTLPFPQPSSGLPSWLLPAGIGAGVLLVAYIALKKKGPTA